jgi:hypothetical protein
VTSVWTGRVVALAIIAALSIYLISVGLDRADKIASGLGVIVAILALFAPYLLPPKPSDNHASSEGASSHTDAITIYDSDGVQVNQASGNRQVNRFGRPE